MSAQRTEPTGAARAVRPPPKVRAVGAAFPGQYDAVDVKSGGYLEGASYRQRLIDVGMLVPLTHRKRTLLTDDVGRVEAANGIFYNEPRAIVRELADGGRPEGSLPDPVVVAALDRMRDDPASCDGRERLFSPGGGRVRYARWPHPAPEESDPATGRAVGFPSPERDALELVMSVREVLAVPGMDERDEKKARGE